jgi:hypothetical protein
MSDILDSINELDDADFDSEEVTLEDTSEEEEIDVLSAELETSEMNETEAREITQAIRAGTVALYILIAQAHERKAHKALGYDTWADYVREEFDMSAQRSYQLIDLSKTISEIESVAPEGTSVKLTEAQARDIKRELPKITEKIKEETKNLSADDASEKVDSIINDIREQKKADEKAINEKQKQIDEAKQEAYHQALEDVADQMLSADQPDSMTSDADNEFVEVDVQGDDAKSLSPQDSMNLYSFFNALSGITSLPEPDDFVNIIPKDRKEEIDNQLLTATAWLNRFQTLWSLNDE